MQSSDFVHLHVHTEYSLLDGASRISELVAKASHLGMPALAITDHGNMHGVVKFYKAALEAGIKPLIGCEAYIATGSRFDKSAGLRESPSHLTLLVRDEEGYRNLLTLVSLAYLEGFYYKPRIDRELLEAHHRGLIALSGCLKGAIPRALAQREEEKAEEWAGYLAELFGRENFYLELHDQGLKEQKEVNPLLVRLGRKLDLPLVCANDCHYVNREDAYSQDTLLCIQTGHKLEDVKRMKMATDEFYLKTPAEMAERFKELPQALSNTRQIADRCHFELVFGEARLPGFPPPPGKTREGYLRELCREGIKRRYGENREDITARLEHELKVIEGKKYASYFLIIWDIINYAKGRKIPVGPGRGSAAGSMVAYLLGITDIDPFRHDLLFERFLNPSRVALPDIDMDFCDQRRGEVIQYVAEKYGRDRVAQIITFGTLGAKAVLRDVGRVKGMLYGDVDRIAKLVPTAPRMTLKKALELEPRLRELYQNNQEVKELIDISFKLEGLARNASTHAAGLVISEKALIENVPLCRGSNDEIITQFDMNDVEEVGLLKMDFLGLRTLTVIMDTVELVEKLRGETVALDEVPLDDPATFELLSKANTVGVFQLESPGMRDLSHRIGLKKFDDLLDLVALFRPGPMHMLEDYIGRKHGKVKIKYDHPGLEPILKNTYGIMLYQEQVMLIANKLAGFSLAEADILRHAMAKKKIDKMSQMEEAFIKGAVKNGISRGLSEKIFRTMARFAEYGFNKSHSAAYALIAYRTAYLKAHYPREYMAALLTSEMNNMDKLMKYVAECQAMGIKVSPPDVNESFSKFTVAGDAILFGLAAVKNVGTGAVESIVSTRQSKGPFKSFFDFLDRVDLFAVNKKVIESLIKCGATDSLEGNRAQKIAVLDRGIEMAHRKQEDRAKGQSTLFDGFDREDKKNGLSFFPVQEEFPQNELLAMEKELLSMYITGHPLSKYEKVLRIYASRVISQLGELKDRSPVRLGGIVEQVVEKVSRRTGRKLAICQLEDLTGVVEMVVYSKAYEKFASLLQGGKPIIVEGRVNSREGGSNIVASDIYPIELAQERLARALHVDLHLANIGEETLKNLLALFRRHRGACPVFLDFGFATGEKILLQAGNGIRVKCTPQLVEAIESVLGEETVYIKT